MTARFAFQRLLSMLVVVLGVSMVTFAISHMVPGDPAQMLAGPRASQETLQQLRETLGLDQPLTVQYGRYVAQLVQGDLGTSIMTGRPVLSDLLRALPATFELVLASLLLSVTFGTLLGSLAAVMKGSALDAAVRGFSTLAISIPSFWLGLVLLLVFYGMLGVAPADGRIGVAFDPPARVTGLFVVDTLLAGDLRAFRDVLAHLALPAITLAVGTAGGVIRVVRTSMLEVLQEDYIRTAVASGLRWRSIVFRHALRNALIPLVTVIGMEAAALLFGAVVVESVFAWPGAGAYVLNAIFALDFPVIMGFTVVVSILYVTINTLTDLLYRTLNPRIREAG